MGMSLSIGAPSRESGGGGSYSEYSERHVIEGSGNGAFLFMGAP